MGEYGKERKGQVVIVGRAEKGGGSLNPFIGSLYPSVTPKFYVKVLHQTTGLTPN